MGQLSNEQLQAFIDAEKILNKTEKDILKIYQGSLTQIRSKIMSLNEKIEWTQYELQKYMRLENIQKQILYEVKNISVEVYKTLKTSYKDIAVNTYNRSHFGYEKEIGVVLRFDKFDSESIKSIINNPYPNITLQQLIQDKYKKYSAKIIMTIGQSLVQGLSAQETARMIKNDLNISYADAVRTVRTEGLRAESKAMLKATSRAEELGIDITKIWHSTLDTRTRPDHRSLDKSRSDKNGMFVLRTGNYKGSKAPAPRMFGIAAEDIQCRCNYLEEIDNVPEEINKRRDNKILKIINEMSYKEWLVWRKKQ